MFGNISVNESHDCLLELDDTGSTVDQNENSDDDDDDDDAEEDSDSEIYVPPGRGFASPDVALDNCLYDQQKYLNQHKWAYYSHSKGGYFCKMCEVVYGDRSCLNNPSRKLLEENLSNTWIVLSIEKP